LGSTFTAEDGSFAFENLDPYQTYELTYSKDGYFFGTSPVSIAIASEEAIQVEAVRDGINRDGCVEMHRSDLKSEVHNLIIGMLKLPGTLLEEPLIDAAMVRQAGDQVQTVLAMNAAFPETFYSCSQNPACLPVRMAQAKRSLRKRLKRMQRFVMRGMREVAKSTRRQNKQVRRSVRRSIQTAQRRVKRYPKTTYLCS
jgi:hypothetical protein